MKYDIYINGTCESNEEGNRVGSCTAIVQTGLISKTYICKLTKKGTHNRAYLGSLILGLRQIPKQSSVIVHTNSNYTINTVKKLVKRGTNNDMLNYIDSMSKEMKLDFVKI